MFALPGGFVGARESPEQTAERKLREKTGVGSVHLEQLRTYADPRARPARLAALDRLHGARAARRRCPRSGPPERDASWHPVDALPDAGARPRDGSSTTGCGGCARAWPTRRGSCASRGGLLPERVHARPGAAALRGAARRAGRRRQLPPRRAGHRAARGHRRAALRRAGAPVPRVRARPRLT